MVKIKKMQQKSVVKIFSIFIFITILTLFILALVIYGPNRVVTDKNSPLNFILFQEPQQKYNEDLVNEWIPKIDIRAYNVDKIENKIPARLISPPINDSLNDNNKGVDIPFDKRKLIIYSHGNAENLFTCVHTCESLSIHTQCDVLSYDYSGYGLNKLSSYERTADGINNTLSSVLKHMLNYGYSLNNIYLFGFSLGTGPSIYVSKQFKGLGGLITLGAYSSIKSVVSNMTNDYIANMFEERWNSLNNIKDVECPILLLHGQHDKLIPASNSKDLHDANPKSKLVILPNVGHITYPLIEVGNLVKKFIKN